MEIQDYCIELVRRWKILIIATVLGSLVGLGLAFASNPTYDASAQLLVGAAQTTDTSDPADSFSNRVTTQVRAYQALARSTDVLNAVIKANDLSEKPDKLLDRVVVSAPGESTVIEVTVTDGNPDIAAKLANSYSEEVIKKVAALDSSRSASIGITMISPAVAADPNDAPPIVPSILRYLSIFLALAVIFISVRIYSRRVVLSADHAATSLRVALLGTVSSGRASETQDRDLTLTATRLVQCLDVDSKIVLASPRGSHKTSAKVAPAVGELVEAVADMLNGTIVVDCTTEGLLAAAIGTPKSAKLTVLRHETTSAAPNWREYVQGLEKQYAGSKVLLFVDPVLISADAGVLAACGVPLVTLVRVGKTLIPDAALALRTVTDHGAKNLGVLALRGER